MKALVWSLGALMIYLAIDSMSLISSANTEDQTIFSDCIEELKVEFIPETLELNRDNFYAVCNHYEVHHPDIVYAQAILESGHFKSNIFKTKNNFLGLYNSRNHDFYEFNHWTECIKAYKTKVQYKYKDGDYYNFLDSIHYAEDANYIKLVKNIEKRLN